MYKGTVKKFMYDISWFYIPFVTPLEVLDMYLHSKLRGKGDGYSVF